MFVNSSSLKSRIKAATIHLGISLVIAAIAALLVFRIWYPYPYREISGGRELFFLVVTVDVILGPLITFAVFNTHKARHLMRLDFFVIGLLQTAALAYGLWTMAVARPVHLVFEVDRFRAVHAIEVSNDGLDKALPEYRKLPLNGPTLVSTRTFSSGKETFDMTMAELQGVDIGSRPDFWQSYEKAKPQVVARAKPLEKLKSRFPDRADEISAVLKASGTDLPDSAVGYLPMIGRNTFWTVLVDKNTSEVIAFVPIDSF